MTDDKAADLAIACIEPAHNMLALSDILYVLGIEIAEDRFEFVEKWLKSTTNQEFPRFFVRKIAKFLAVFMEG